MMFFFRADNPVTEIEDFRMEVLILMPQLDTLDKEEYAPEEKQEAQAAYEERKAEFDLEAEIPEEEVMNSTCSVSPRGGKLADWAIYFACVNSSDNQATSDINLVCFDLTSTSRVQLCRTSIDQ